MKIKKFKKEDICYLVNNKILRLEKAQNLSPIKCEIESFSEYYLVKLLDNYTTSNTTYSPGKRLYVEEKDLRLVKNTPPEYLK